MATAVPKRVELLDSYTVLIKAVYNSGKGKLLNLSSTGVYVETPMYLLPQAQVRLQIVLPEEKRWIEADAVVAWENRGKTRRGGLPPGYGLRFLTVPDETAAAIGKILRTAEPAAEVVAEAAQSEAVVRFELPTKIDYETDAAEDGPPYPLRENVVHAHTPDGARGIFVLSYDGAQDAFIGRADADLRSTLLQYVGQYAYFYHEIIEGTGDRFVRECELFHRLGGDHGQLDNTCHPTAPEGSGLSCPVCPSEGPGRVSKRTP